MIRPASSIITTIGAAFTSMLTLFQASAAPVRAPRAESQTDRVTLTQEAQTPQKLWITTPVKIDTRFVKDQKSYKLVLDATLRLLSTQEEVLSGIKKSNILLIPVTQIKRDPETYFKGNRAGLSMLRKALVHFKPQPLTLNHQQTNVLPMQYVDAKGKAHYCLFFDVSKLEVKKGESLVLLTTETAYGLLFALGKDHYVTSETRSGLAENTFLFLTSLTTDFNNRLGSHPDPKDTNFVMQLENAFQIVEKQLIEYANPKTSK